MALYTTRYRLISVHWQQTDLFPLCVFNISDVCSIKWINRFVLITVYDIQLAGARGFIGVLMSFRFMVTSSKYPIEPFRPYSKRYVELGIFDTTRATRTPAFWEYPRRPMITILSIHIISDSLRSKSKQDKFNVTKLSGQWVDCNWTSFKMTRILPTDTSNVSLKFGVDIQSQAKFRVRTQKKYDMAARWPFSKRQRRDSIGFFLPIHKGNVWLKFGLDFKSKNKATVWKPKKSNMAPRRPFWKWRRWKPIG